MKWMLDWQAWLLVVFFIAVHEGGHFTAAKLMDMLVLELSTGVGPGLVLFQVGETEFRLGIVPLAGYTKIYDVETMGLPPGVKPSRRASLKMAAVSAAGLVFQAALMFFAAFLLYRLAGGSRRHGGYIITELDEGSPARTLELAPGDRLFRVNGRLVCSAEELAQALGSSGPQAVLTFQHGSKAVPLRLTGITTGGFSIEGPGGELCRSSSYPDMVSIPEVLRLNGDWVKLPQRFPLRQRIHGFMRFQVATFMDCFGSVCPTEYPEMNPFEHQKRELLWSTLRWSFEVNLVLVIFNLLPQPFSDGDKLVRHLSLALIPDLPRGAQAEIQILLVVALLCAGLTIGYCADRFLGIARPPKGPPTVIPR